MDTGHSVPLAIWTPACGVSRYPAAVSRDRRFLLQNRPRPVIRYALLVERFEAVRTDRVGLEGVVIARGTVGREVVENVATRELVREAIKREGGVPGPIDVDPRANRAAVLRLERRRRLRSACKALLERTVLAEPPVRTSSLVALPALTPHL